MRRELLEKIKRLARESPVAGERAAAQAALDRIAAKEAALRKPSSEPAKHADRCSSPRTFVDNSPWLRAAMEAIRNDQLKELYKAMGFDYNQANGELRFTGVDFGHKPSYTVHYYAYGERTPEDKGK
jgi:hypothetical protein